MKKIFIGIFSIILGFVGFSFGLGTFNDSVQYGITVNSDFNNGQYFYNPDGNIFCLYILQYYSSDFYLYLCNSSGQDYITCSNQYGYMWASEDNGLTYCFTGNGYYYHRNKNNNTTSNNRVIAISTPYSDGGGSSSCEDKNITVFYNSGSSESILCDGTQAIEIKGLSSLTSSNTFTPYFNISYRDEDNQSLIESYSKDILYLENGQFKKTYTGNNDWILTVQGDVNNSFNGYLPIFEITGGIEDVSGSGNIFNNFAENSVKFTLANIPSYIQYFIILLILFLILGFVKKFKRK